MTTLDVQDVLVGLLDCTACTHGVGSVLTDMSVDHFKGSFNADPVNAVSIIFADVAVEIPAGVSIELTNLELWGVVKVIHASFALNAAGVFAAFEAEPVKWGPLSITSASDSKRGPQFEMVLQASEQSLLIDGKATVFGQSVSLYLQMSDDAVEGHFELSFGSALQADVTMISNGRPGQPGFSNTVHAELEADLIGAIVRASTKYLLDLSDDMDKELADAEKAVESADKAWDNAKAELSKVKTDTAADIKDAEEEVSRAKQEVDKFDCGNVWLVSKACDSAKKVVKKALSAAETVLSGVRKAATALISLAEDIVEESKILLDFAEEVLTWAEGAVDVFTAVVDAIGDVLGKMLIVHSMVFTSDVSNADVAVSYYADVTIFGKRDTMSFAVRINFQDIVDLLSQQLTYTFHADFDGEMINEKPGSPTAVGSIPNTIAGQVGLVRDASFHVYVINHVDIPDDEAECSIALDGCNDIERSSNSYYAKYVQKKRKKSCQKTMKARCEESRTNLARDLWVQESLLGSGQRGVSSRLRGLAVKIIESESASTSCDLNKKSTLAALSKTISKFTKFTLCSVSSLQKQHTDLEDKLDSEAKAVLQEMITSSQNATQHANEHALKNRDYEALNAKCAGKSTSSCLILSTLKAEVTTAALGEATSAVQRDAVDEAFFTTLDIAKRSAAAGEVLFLSTMEKVLDTWFTELRAEISIKERQPRPDCRTSSGKVLCDTMDAELESDRSTYEVLATYRDRIRPYFA